MHFGAWFWAKDIKESLKKHEKNLFILMVEINTLEVIGVGRGSPLGHFLFFEYVFRNLNPKPSDPIRRCNATFLQLQALYSATHDGCACSVVGVLAVSMSCGPELECHGAANRYFCDRALTYTDFFIPLDWFWAEKNRKRARAWRWRATSLDL